MTHLSQTAQDNWLGFASFLLAMQAAALADLGRWDEAKARILWAIELLDLIFKSDDRGAAYDKDAVYLFSSLGVVCEHIALRDRDRMAWRESEEAFRKALAKDGANVTALYGVGRCKWFLGNKDEAIRVYEDDLFLKV